MDTSDEWIEKRTGIKRRRFVVDSEGSVPLAEAAARQALEGAGLSPSDLDLIVCCTLSPDIDFPGNSALLQERLGLAGIPAFDLRNQCSGFIYGIAVADQYIRTGGARYVLLVGSEVHSTGTEFSTRGRDVTVLFGDGAGAVVLGPSEDACRGLLGFRLHAEGRFADKLCVEGPGHRRSPRVSEALMAPESDFVFPRMDGRYVFKHAVVRLTEVIKEVLDDQGMGPEAIDMLVPHQANLRINQLVAMGLNIGEDRMVNNIEKYGNTTAATIPILLGETLEAGRIVDGDVVCMAAFGSGFTWGATLFRW